MSTELKPEDKQRIEVEERKRAAEEQYRASVRASLEESHTPARLGRGLGIVLAVLAVAVAIVVLIWDRQMKAARAEAARVEAARLASIPQIHYAPVSKTIAAGQLTLNARDARIFRFTITRDMREPHVVGRFTAGGTNGADIEALLMSEDEFPNWDHRHQAKVLYSTNGPKTTDRFDVPLEPGEYVLIFSNRAALFFSRYITPEVELNYTRAEAK
jgi:hypothetical protein